MINTHWHLCLHKLSHTELACSDAKGTVVTAESTVEPGAGEVAVRRTAIATFPIGKAIEGAWLQKKGGEGSAVGYEHTPHRHRRAAPGNDTLSLVLVKTEVRPQSEGCCEFSTIHQLANITSLQSRKCKGTNKSLGDCKKP